jgi:hypothetical protein
MAAAAQIVRAHCSPFTPSRHTQTHPRCNFGDLLSHVAEPRALAIVHCVSDTCPTVGGVQTGVHWNSRMQYQNTASSPSALAFILRQMARFWQTGLTEIAAFDRPRAARLQGSLGFANGQSATACTANLAELVQLRSRGSTTTGTLPSPTGQAGCTELVPLYLCRPFGRFAAAGGRQHQRQLSKGFHFFPG